MRSVEGMHEAKLPAAINMPPEKTASAKAEKLIGDPAPGQRSHIDHGGVQSIDNTGVRDVEPEAAYRYRGGHEQDQQRAHPVVAEPLPHFCEEVALQVRGGVRRSAYVADSGTCASTSHVDVAYGSERDPPYRDSSTTVNSRASSSQS